MEYDPFQKQAIQEINQGHSVIVSAPTGAGKTAIAEHVIAECLRKGEKVIYTAPIKALSNQKFREFSEDNPEKVGILTGDITLNAQAPVLIMTTEIFRNKILEEQSSLMDYTWIIFDEIHYLDDYQRGSVWEESLIFLPDHMRVLGLSATVPNIDQLSGWLESIHGHAFKVIKEEKRPVPLHFYYQCQNGIYGDISKLAKQGYRSPGLHYRGVGKLPRQAATKPNRLSSLITHLEEGEMFPCIYFVFSRRRAESLAEELVGFQFVNAEEERDIIELYDKLCHKFEVAGEPSAEKLKPLIRQGVAYHHAGMLPTLKEVVERLFTSRMIKVIFTTETFALGINMPARTVIFDELRKFYGRSFGTLKTRDFYQMAGRAGRRSIDTEGFVFCRVNPHYIAPEELHKVIFHKPERVRSQFNASYATILNLYQKYRDDLYDIYPRSFHYYQVQKYQQERAVDFMRNKVELLTQLGYIADRSLTEKGRFAANVYGYEMILAELYEEGILEQLETEDLGIMCLAVVHEPRKGAWKPQLSRRVNALEREADKIMTRINRAEKAAGIRDVSKKAFFHLTPALKAWLAGEPFRDILEYVDADEGEVVRYFRMTIQVMREIAEAPVSSVLKNKIFSLIDQIDKDVIDSEKQLRG